MSAQTVFVVGDSLIRAEWDEQPVAFQRTRTDGPLVTRCPLCGDDWHVKHTGEEADGSVYHAFDADDVEPYINSPYEPAQLLCRSCMEPVAVEVRAAKPTPKSEFGAALWDFARELQQLQKGGR